MYLCASRSAARGISGENVLFDDLSLNEVLLDDLFKHLWITRVVPNSFRVNDRYGATRAHSQAVHLGSIDQRVRADQL